MVKTPVHRVDVPNPFPEGRTCVYLIVADPVTLIDTGVATEKAYDALVGGLKMHGLVPRDIRRVVLTHKHIDHLGNAWQFQRLNGAEIYIHECEQEAVASVDPSGERFARTAESRLDEWHVPMEVRAAETVGLGPHWLIEPAEPMPLVDGQHLPLADGFLEVIHTPGHTLGSVCLKLGRDLFSGDHLLPDISPNVGGGDLGARGLLRHYLTSLARIRDLAREQNLIVLPGHGDAFTTAVERCDELIHHHEERLEEILEILRRSGPLSVYELACALFGNLEGFHIVLGCAEAHAHLEWLEDEGQIIENQGNFSGR